MMQTLYPIIHRKRRPLVVADAPPVVVGNVEPVKAVAKTPSAEQASEAIQAGVAESSVADAVSQEGENHG
jgi:hypothetical protein